MRKRLIALVTLVAGLLVCASAAATPNFPPVIQQILSAPASPACSLCHVGGVTQRGTVNTAFGAAMRQRGLVAYEEAALRSALDQMQRDAVDSNGNGVTDIEELKAGKDPNAGAANVDPPQYGCVGYIARGSVGAREIGLLGLALTVAIFRRRFGRDAAW
jgi:hypothetical protein